MLPHILQGVGLVALAIGMASFWSCGRLFASGWPNKKGDFLQGVIIFLAIEGVIAIFILGGML